MLCGSAEYSAGFFLNAHESEVPQQLPGDDANPGEYSIESDHT